MFLYRKALDHLNRWASHAERKPLILRGARQTGKTACIRELAEQSGLELCEVNFERNKNLIQVFDKDLDPKRIVSELEIFTGQSIAAGRTLMFFDEVQDCPNAITSLRYFYEEMPELHVIAAGSLLEFVLSKVSIPVGRVSYEYMYPMSFQEFLLATNRSKLMEYIPHLTKVFHASNNSPVSEVASVKLQEALKEYFIVGGMPEAVAKFAASGSYLDVATVQDDIIQTYRDDIYKYASGALQTENVVEVFNSVFKFVGKQLVYSHLVEHDSSKRTKKSLELLEQAMLVKRVSSVHPKGLPLGAEVSSKHFKCIFLDIGLGQRMSGYRSKDILTSGNLLTSYEGKLAEQFVGQQLLAESGVGSEDRNLFCWIRPERGASAEVDYVIVRDGEIIPVEVKSGKAGSLRSLHMFLKQFGGRGVCLQDIPQVVTSDMKSHDMAFLPLYSLL